MAEFSLQDTCYQSVSVNKEVEHPVFKVFSPECSTQSIIHLSLKVVSMLLHGVNERFLGVVFPDSRNFESRKNDDRLRVLQASVIAARLKSPSPVLRAQRRSSQQHGGQFRVLEPIRLMRKGKISPTEMPSTEVEVIQQRGGGVTTHSALTEHQQLLLLR